MTRLRAALARRRPTSRQGRRRASWRASPSSPSSSSPSPASSWCVPWVYGEYGFHPSENAQSWAALTPQYADSAVCQRCHAAQYAPWQARAARRRRLRDVPRTAGRARGDRPVRGGSPADRVGQPTRQGCARSATSRSPAGPLGFPSVDLTEHYAGGAVPRLPRQPRRRRRSARREISHSLDRLPACVTCHEPAGLKPVPVGHVEAADAVCQTCHKRPTADQ